jgi:peptidoglycan/xylan/chitin deacetylase (PgdA/CDA1 family)
VRAHRGGILLLHETHRNTVQQLDELVRRLKEEGYSFTTPDDLAYAPSLR